MITRIAGPVGRDDIADFIAEQVIGAGRENSERLADAAIRHGLETGWMVRYDDVPDAYVMAG